MGPSFLQQDGDWLGLAKHGQHDQKDHAPDSGGVPRRALSGGPYPGTRGTSVYTMPDDDAKNLTVPYNDKDDRYGDASQGRRTNSGHRPLNLIAEDISRAWRKQGSGVHYAARPYLDALADLDDIEDNYGADTARSVVAYFLSNATSFRGPEAQRLKGELKALLKKSEVAKEEIQYDPIATGSADLTSESARRRKRPGDPLEPNSDGIHRIGAFETSKALGTDGNWLERHAIAKHGQHDQSEHAPHTPGKHNDETHEELSGLGDRKDAMPSRRELGLGQEPTNMRGQTLRPFKPHLGYGVRKHGNHDQSAHGGHADDGDGMPHVQTREFPKRPSHVGYSPERGYFDVNSGEPLADRHGARFKSENGLDGTEWTGDWLERRVEKHGAHNQQDHASNDKQNDLAWQRSGRDPFGNPVAHADRVKRYGQQVLHTEHDHHTIEDVDFDGDSDSEHRVLSIEPERRHLKKHGQHDQKDHAGAGWQGTPGSADVYDHYQSAAHGARLPHGDKKYDSGSTRRLSELGYGGQAEKLGLFYDAVEQSGLSGAERDRYANALWEAMSKHASHDQTEHGKRDAYGREITPDMGMRMDLRTVDRSGRLDGATALKLLSDGLATRQENSSLLALTDKGRALLQRLSGGRQPVAAARSTINDTLQALMLLRLLSEDEEDAKRKGKKDEVDLRRGNVAKHGQHDQDDHGGDRLSGGAKTIGGVGHHLPTNSDLRRVHQQMRAGDPLSDRDRDLAAHHLTDAHESAPWSDRDLSPTGKPRTTDRELRETHRTEHARGKWPFLNWGTPGLTGKTSAG